MERSLIVRKSGMLAALAAGFVAIGVAGCGEGEGADSVDTKQSGVVTWTNLQLLNGWQSFGAGYTPQVAIINGTVTFKGALKGQNATSDVAFKLDGPTFSAFRTQPSLESVSMRTVMGGNPNAGGTVWVQFVPEVPQVNPETVQVRMVQDGVTFGGIGAQARELTSLDGVAYDQAPGAGLAFNTNNWASKYFFRQQDDFQCAGLNDCGVYAKLVGGFVRFQGALQTAPDESNFDGYVMTLTDPSLIPGQLVTVPVSLGVDSSFQQDIGMLSVYPNGNVFLSGSTQGATAGVVFEGAAFSKTNSGNVPFTLRNNWVAYSARQVKVGNFGGVVRFQGAIKNGTDNYIGDLPVGMRPSKTVRVVAHGALSAWQATIIIETNGAVTFQGIALNYAASHLSLDSVSFPL